MKHLLTINIRYRRMIEYREEWDNRPPALGATPKLLAELQSHYAILPNIQQRILHKSLRDKMLRQFISCDGSTNSMDDLVNILQKEMESGIPSSVPDGTTLT